MLHLAPDTIDPPPLKVSPQWNSTRLPAPRWEEPVAVEKLEVRKTAAPAGHSPLPATGVLEAATQVVLVPGKPFVPAGSYAVTPIWQLAVFVPSVAVTVAVYAVSTPGVT